MFFLGLWWEPLENNASIFFLRTGFPLFFLACDGNLWKIVSISSIWKRIFRVFSGLVMGTSFENGISVSFWAFLEHNATIFYLKTGLLFLGLWWEPLENNANIFYLKTEFPCFFWACDGNLIWKRDNANIFHVKTGFPLFWACDGNLWKIMPISSIWKRDFRCFFCLWWQPLDNNINIFYLKTEFPCFFWACDGNLIWKREFRVFLGFSGI